MSLSSDLHVSATQMFIDANPIKNLTISRPVLSDDGAGGTTPGTPKTMPPICARLVGLNLRTAEASLTTADGQMVVPKFALITLPSADVEIGDQFTQNGKLHEVLTVQRTPGWRNRCEVYRHA